MSAAALAQMTLEQLANTQAAFPPPGVTPNLAIHAPKQNYFSLFWERFSW